MTTQLSLTDQGIRIDFSVDEDKALARAAPFLVVVMKARQTERSLQVVAGDPARNLEAVMRFFDKHGLALSLDESAEALRSKIAADHQEFSQAMVGGAAPVDDTHALDLDGFERELTDKQRESVAHLFRVRNGANFSVPGAGKTTIAYATFQALKNVGLVDRMLVVAPRAAFAPWEEEFEGCFKRKPTSVRLTQDRLSRDRVYAMSGDYELFLLTYQMATNDIDRLMGICRRHKVLLVLDESHYVKRIGEGQWADAVLSVAPLAAHRVILTGTPMPQGYQDLWTQFTFLWPGRDILGQRNAYRRRCEREEFEFIREQVRPFFRRITKSDLALPELIVERHEVPMAPQQARLYGAIRERFLRDLRLAPDEHEALRSWRRARMVRLLQAASNPALLSSRSEEFALAEGEALDLSVVEVAKNYAEIEMPAKFSAAREAVRELVTAGKKVVVWTSFVRNIEMFQKLIGEFVQTFVVYGAVPRDAGEDEEFNREQQISLFKSSGEAAVLIANPAACGESISLHHASRDAIYIDRTFDCARYLQSQDRIHRFGLLPGEDVRVQLLVCPGSIDEAVDDRLLAKAERMRALLEGELPAGTFSDMDDDQSEDEKDFDATLRAVQPEKPA